MSRSQRVMSISCLFLLTLQGARAFAEERCADREEFQGSSHGNVFIARATEARDPTTGGATLEPVPHHTVAVSNADFLIVDGRSREEAGDECGTDANGRDIECIGDEA